MKCNLIRSHSNTNPDISGVSGVLVTATVFSFPYYSNPIEPSQPKKKFQNSLKASVRWGRRWGCGIFVPFQSEWHEFRQASYQWPVITWNRFIQIILFSPGRLSLRWVSLLHWYYLPHLRRSPTRRLLPASTSGGQSSRLPRVSTVRTREEVRITVFHYFIDPLSVSGSMMPFQPLSCPADCLWASRNNGDWASCSCYRSPQSLRRCIGEEEKNAQALDSIPFPLIDFTFPPLSCLSIWYAW